MTKPSEHLKLGTTLTADGVEFRLWAPNANQVSVIGTFNHWNGDANPMQPEEGGYWHTKVVGAVVGDQYKYQLATATGVITRMTPMLAKSRAPLATPSSMTPNLIGMVTTFSSNHGINS